MLGRRVKEARQAKNLSQAQLATGRFSRSYISAIESGRINPSAENLKVIAQHLGLPLSYFLPSEQESLTNKLETMLKDRRQ